MEGLLVFYLLASSKFIILALDFNFIKMNERPLNRLSVVLAENQKSNK